MTEEEFDSLKVGDMIINKWHNSVGIVMPSRTKNYIVISYALGPIKSRTRFHLPKQLISYWSLTKNDI